MRFITPPSFFVFTLICRKSFHHLNTTDRICIIRVYFYSKVSFFFFEYENYLAFSFFSGLKNMKGSCQVAIVEGRNGIKLDERIQ